MPSIIGNKKFIASFLAILFLAIGVFCYQSFKSKSQDASAAGESWLTGWSKRKEVTVNNFTYGPDLSSTSYTHTGGAAAAQGSPVNLSDNNNSTQYYGQGGYAGAFPSYATWVQIDFGSGNEKTIAQLRLLDVYSGAYPLTIVKFYGSNTAMSGTGDEGTTLVNHSGSQPLLQSDGFYEFSFSNSTAYRYYKVVYWGARAAAYEWELKELNFTQSGTLMGNPTLGATGKFGTAVNFDGSGDYITVPSSSDFAMGTGDFTVDFWVKFSSLADSHFVGGDTANNLDIYYVHSATRLQIVLANQNQYYTTWTPSVGTWYHIAVVRSGTSLKSYINGQLLGSYTDSSNIPTTGIGIGRNFNGTNYFNGYIDEVRISKGIARWTSNFTPPTFAYPNDLYTKLLFHLDESVGSSTIYSGSSLTNYQVPLTVSYDSDMQSDFDDLRFTSSDGSTLLDYWIESKTDSSTAKVWVEVPVVALGANTIYMYYGNASAVTTSNGDNTFVVFDDFNGTTLDTNKWDVASGSSYSIANSSITVNPGSATGWSKSRIESKTDLGPTGSYAVKFSGVSFPASGNVAALGFVNCRTWNDVNAPTCPMAMFWSHPTADFYMMTHSGSAWGVAKAVSGKATSNAEILLSGTGPIIYKKDDVQAYSGMSNAVFNPSMHVFLTNYDPAAYPVPYSIGLIFVRNYNAVEPTYSFGQEGSFSYDQSCVSSASVTCTQTTDGSYIINTYTLSGSSSGTTTWTPPTGVTSVEYLVVGGGGGSSYYGGGGGAGGYKAGTTTVTAGSALAIEVGAGGTTISASDIRGTSGGQSKFDTIISAGGGGGGAPYLNSGGNGGSGGGGGADYHTSGTVGAGGSATAGNVGGAGGLGDGSHMRGSGGGGGAGGAGAAGTTSSGGAGGVGVVNDITGSNVWYAGGGGGGGYNCPGGAGTQATGGGGAGEYYNSGYHYLPSTRNGINGTGGGAGSWLSESGISVGGSGIVVIKYILDGTPPVLAQVTAVPSPTTDTTPSYTFSSTEDGIITYGGDCSSSTTSATVGNNAITFNTLAQGTHSNCTIMVTDASSNQSNTLNVNTFIIATNSCWYCEHYYDSSNVLQAGKNGQLDFTFTYEDSNSSATLSGYRVAIDTENLSLDDIDSQADIISPSVSTWNAGGSAAPGATITYSGTSVKVSPSAELYQIGYGNGSTVKTYYWWVKVKNSSDIESEWIPGPAFNTPKKHYPIVRVVADKANIIANTNIQYCSGTDLSNQTVPASRDACYSVCWAGTAGSAVVDPDNANWKCSVCYNSSGTPVSCSTLNDGATAFTWKVPSGFVEDTDYALTSGTLSSANPIIKFLTTGTDLKMGLSITGSACAAEQTGDIKKGLPSWKEVSPF